MHTFKYLPFLSILFLSSSSLVFFAWQDKSYKYDLPQTVVQDTLERIDNPYSIEIELKDEGYNNCSIWIDNQKCIDAPFFWDHLYQGTYWWTSPQNRVPIRFLVKKTIKMKVVQRFFDSCLLNDQRKVELVTGYSKENYIGVQSFLPPPFTDLQATIYNRRKQKKYEFHPPHPDGLSFKKLIQDHKNIIYITAKDEILFNQEKVSTLELTNKLKNTKQALLIYSEEASYGQFLKTKALIHKTIIKDNLNTMALEKWGKAYKKLSKEDRRMLRKEARSINEQDYTYQEVSEVVYKVLMKADY